MTSGPWLKLNDTKLDTREMYFTSIFINIKHSFYGCVEFLVRPRHNGSKLLDSVREKSKNVLGPRYDDIMPSSGTEPG